MNWAKQNKKEKKRHRRAVLAYIAALLNYASWKTGSPYALLFPVNIS